MHGSGRGCRDGRRVLAVASDLRGSAASGATRSKGCGGTALLFLRPRHGPAKSGSEDSQWPSRPPDWRCAPHEKAAKIRACLYHRLLMTPDSHRARAPARSSFLSVPPQCSARADAAARGRPKNEVPDLGSNADLISCTPLSPPNDLRSKSAGFSGSRFSASTRLPAPPH